MKEINFAAFDRSIRALLTIRRNILDDDDLALKVARNGRFIAAQDISNIIEMLR